MFMHYNMFTIYFRCLRFPALSRPNVSADLDIIAEDISIKSGLRKFGSLISI